MTSALESWHRKYFVTGGGDPFLFYVVYGDIDLSTPLSRAHYRSNGNPDGIEVTCYGFNDCADVPGGFRQGYLWDEFVRDDANRSTVVAQCQQCTIVRGTPTDSTTLDYLRDTVGLIAYLVDCGGCAVYDPFGLCWWSPSDWRQQLFEPAAPVPHQHTAIVASEEADCH